MAGMRLEFAQFGSFDSFSIYRSDYPMDISNLPAPIATGLKQMYFIDGTALEEKRYYYRVAVIRGSETLISEEMLSPDNDVAPIEYIPTDYILRYDFNNNVEDKSVNALNGVLAGNVTYGAGRTPDANSAVFNGGTVKTNAALPINSKKISISFWFKTSNNSISFFMILGGADTANKFVIQANNAEGSAIGIETYDGPSKANHGATAVGVTNGAWRHVIFTVDRSATSHEETTKAYLDGGSAAPPQGYRSSILSGEFDSEILTIGNHTVSDLLSFPYSYRGSIQQLRIYNRILTAEERLQLFEE